MEIGVLKAVLQAEVYWWRPFDMLLWINSMDLEPIVFFRYSQSLKIENDKEHSCMTAAQAAGKGLPSRVNRMRRSYWHYELIVNNFSWNYGIENKKLTRLLSECSVYTGNVECPIMLAQSFLPHEWAIYLAVGKTLEEILCDSVTAPLPPTVKQHAE